MPGKGGRGALPAAGSASAGAAGPTQGGSGVACLVAFGVSHSPWDPRETVGHAGYGEAMPLT